jgi:hypothetical protein
MATLTGVVCALIATDPLGEILKKVRRRSLSPPRNGNKAIRAKLAIMPPIENTLKLKKEEPAIDVVAKNIKKLLMVGSVVPEQLRK